MQARKRAKADARAAQLKQAQDQQFLVNKLQAQHNKYSVTGKVPNNGNGTQSVQSLQAPRMGRAASMDIFDEMLSDDTNGDSGGMSEPQIISEYDRAINTIIERTEEIMDSDIEDDDDELDDDLIQDEIDELKQTLAEHTVQIEEIKNTILVKQKEQFSDSDSADAEDVEAMLNQQEKTMRTMRIQEMAQQEAMKMNAVKQRHHPMKNDIENGVYRKVTSPNNIDAVYHQRSVIDQHQMDIDEESEESSDEEMPIGRLVDRIEFIKRKCVTAMGVEGFKMAYSLMKQLQYEDKADLVEAIDNKIKQLCVHKKVSKSRVVKYRSLIDQLLFIEANCS